MNKIKAIIFDFDGVIAESVNVKTDAFAEMYRPYGQDVVNKVVSHHTANGGVSRFEKFKIYHSEYLGKQITEDDVQVLAGEFSNLVLNKVVSAPYVKGADEFIKNNYKKYKFFISTGTPESEMIEILKRRGLSKFFIEVKGSPVQKGVHVKDILNKYNFSKDEVAFVGDAVTDRDAAKNNEIIFIGRYTTCDVIKKEKYLIEDFYQLKKLLKIIQ